MADYRKLARAKARKYGLNPTYFERQIGAESGFNPNARSPVGAQGIAQIMPATARGWGVDPSDPEAALDAAAKNMARYVKRYGSYENALRAYNAGPAAIEKSRRYRETNDYVAKILKGAPDGGGGLVSRVSGGTPRAPRATPASRTREVTTEVLDERGLEAARQRFALAQYLGRRKPDSVLLKVLPSAPPDERDFLRTETTSERVAAPGGARPAPSRRSTPATKGTRPSSQLLEAFHDPEGGIKHGKEIGAIGGHGGHVHIATGPKQLAAIKKLATDMGLTITSTTGGKHAPNSYHYAGKAVDVAGDPKQMRRFYRKVKLRYGIK